ncbi:MAG: chemotaxis-specific protein-glutamate methyltransferase CheB [Eubacterium sp.]|nr:chemotaxis-specific protein-glutamate methyltransferase CheB [Eubacterium sp.]
MKKNLLVVDDSALMRRVICDIINTDSDYEAKDVCRDGQEAFEAIKKYKYDAVLLDVNMPRMDGLQLLEKLQKERIRVTVIMVSTLTTKDADVTIKAMELGAIDFVTKPDNIGKARGEDFKKNLLGIVNAVLKSGNTKNLFTPTPAPPKKGTVPKAAMNAPKSKGGKKCIAIASSTGGPKALQSVIPFIAENIDAPLLLVQHMPAGFTKSMADRLNEISNIEVAEAKDGDKLEKGKLLVAPGGFHFEVVPCPDGSHKIHLDKSPAVGGLRPYANLMYESLKQSKFDEITCVVLTGMGADGTEGIVSLKKKKKLHIISQNEETCVVYGMPKSIAETGLVDEVVPLTEVASSINKKVGIR